MSSADPARRRRLGLRGRVILTFAVGAALVSLALAVSVFTISRGYLDAQRERSAQRQAAADAAFVRTRLAVPGAAPGDVLTAVDPPANTVLLLHRHDQWYSSEPDISPDVLPDPILAPADEPGPAILPVTIRGEPFLAVAVPLGADATFYELAPVQELRSTLTVLRTVLAASALAATLGGAALGLWAGRRVLQPLHRLAGTAAHIAGGRLDTRLADTGDRDLATLVESFNRMVDSLQQRIERERRLVGDVSHELRTPLTTLVTSVGVMRRHRDDLPERSRHALDLVSTELDHLHRLLEDLLALAKTEAGLHQDQPEPLSLRDLLIHTLADTARSADLLTVHTDGIVLGRKLALERTLINLMDNADRHGGGLTQIGLHRDADHAAIVVDDNGPGVPAGDRTAIFQRFTTGQATRGSSAGTGLGLALVAETIAAHHGQVRCADRPGGGARFIVRLPLAPGVTQPQTGRPPGLNIREPTSS